MSTTGTTIDLEQQMLGEVEMVGRDRWDEIHRRAGARGRGMGLHDRATYQPYQDRIDPVGA